MPVSTAAAAAAAAAAAGLTPGEAPQRARAIFHAAEETKPFDPADLSFEFDEHGTAEGEIDLSWLHILMWIRAAVFDSPSVNYLNAMNPKETSA